MKVKVRIAVAVDDYGAWEAQGCSYLSTDKSKKYVLARDQLRPCTNSFLIEAELDVPEVKTVQGDVVSQNEN